MSENARETFAFNLRRIAEQKGRGQTDFVTALSCSSSTVSDWFSGKKYPRVNMMQRIADFLGVRLQDLTSSHRTQEEPEVGYDDFTYALYNESKELTEENKQKLLELARFFKQDQDRQTQKEAEE